MSKLRKSGRAATTGKERGGVDSLDRDDRVHVPPSIAASRYERASVLPDLLLIRVKAGIIAANRRPNSHKALSPLRRGRMFLYRQIDDVQHGHADEHAAPEIRAAKIACR